VPNELRDGGEPNFRASGHVQYSVPPRSGVSAAGADSFGDVDERRVAGMGFTRTKNLRRNARPPIRNLDLCGKSDGTVRLSVLSLLWLRSGILRRLRFSRCGSDAPSRTLVRFLWGSVLRPFLLLLHSADDLSPIQDSHVFKRTRNVVPIFGAALPINSGRVGTPSAPV